MKNENNDDLDNRQDDNTGANAGGPNHTASIASVVDEEATQAFLSKNKAALSTISLEESTLPVPVHLTKRGIIKNLVIVSLCFMLMFSAFATLQNLQSTLNRQGGLGTTSLSVLYFVSIASGLFLPPVVMATIGCKWSMVISMVAYLSYVGANFYPTWATILPTSILLGLATPILWAAKMATINQLGTWFSQLTGTKHTTVMSRFSGIFYGFFMTSIILGNLCSSLILKKTDQRSEMSTDQAVVCGIRLCPGTVSNVTTLEEFDINKARILVGVLAGGALVGLLTMALSLDSITVAVQGHRVLSAERLLTALKHLRTSRYQQLLIPATVYQGLSIAFLYGDITVAFISCPFGVGGIGFVMISYGVSSALFSNIFGHIAKYTGQVALFVTAWVCQGGVLVALLLWTPRYYYIIHCLAVVWGVGDAVYRSTLFALYSHTFKDNPTAAFSCFISIANLGWAISFGYSGYLCTRVKLYITLIVLSIGSVLLILVKLLQRRSKRHKPQRPAVTE